MCPYSVAKHHTVRSNLVKNPSSVGTDQKVIQYIRTHIFTIICVVEDTIFEEKIDWYDKKGSSRRGLLTI